MEKSRKKVTRNIIIILSLIAAGVFIAIRLYTNKKHINEKNKVVDRSTMAIPVNTVKVAVQPVSGSFILPAVLEPEAEADISIGASGKLQSLNIKLGSQVKKGQVIGSIDNSIKQINLQSAQLLLDKSEREYNRYKTLWAGNATTEIEYLNAQYNYENAKTQVAQIKQQITDGTVISPISGVIIKKNVEQGEFVNIGMVIASVVNVSKLKATVMVGESNIYQIREKMKATITCDIYPGIEFNATVNYVSPQGDASHNYQVQLEVENKKNAPLKGGTFVKVQFETDKGKYALQIPKIALVEGMKNPLVYIVKNNKSELRKIVLGRELGENVEVLQGLEIGEEVITSGQINLSEGSMVEIIKNK